jgi:transcriptional antiterminator NusG
MSPDVTTEEKGHPSEDPATSSETLDQAVPSSAGEEPQEGGEGMMWYVIHTYSGFEAKVKSSIEEGLKTSPLRGQIGKLLIPTEDVVEIRGGKRRISARKYFPGYILIQMRMNTETWYVIKNTPKVTGFLGGENLPTPLAHEEVERILERMRVDTTAKPKVLFEKGQSVRVIEGPFMNFTGVIDDMNPF